MNTQIYNEETQLQRYTAISFITYVVLMLAASISLIFVFNFPVILREPVDAMLRTFNEGRDLIVPAYYIFVLSGIAFIIMSVLSYKSLSENNSTIGLFVLIFGILFGLTSNLGFIRWPFLMDYLASVISDPAVSEINKDTVRIVFESFHNYAGVAVGENFAFWFEGFWIISLSILIKRRSDLFPAYMHPIGFVLGAGMLIYTLEQFGGIFALLGVTNIIIHAGLLVWLLAMSVLMIKNKAGSEKPGLGKLTAAVLMLFYLSLLATAF